MARMSFHPQGSPARVAPDARRCSRTTFGRRVALRGGVTSGHPVHQRERGAGWGAMPAVARSPGAIAPGPMARMSFHPQGSPARIAPDAKRYSRTTFGRRVALRGGVTSGHPVHQRERGAGRGAMPAVARSPGAIAPGLMAWMSFDPQGSPARVALDANGCSGTTVGRLVASRWGGTRDTRLLDGNAARGRGWGTISAVALSPGAIAPGLMARMSFDPQG